MRLIVESISTIQDVVRGDRPSRSNRRVAAIILVRAPLADGSTAKDFLGWSRNFSIELHGIASGKAKDFASTSLRMQMM